MGHPAGPCFPGRRSGRPRCRTGSFRRAAKTREPLGWLRSEALDALLGDDEGYRQYLAAGEAWRQLMSRSALKSPYQPNLSDEDKLAGLSAFWSEARFGFVYFDQVPNLDWHRTYRDFIPRVLATDSTEAYYREMMRFAALLEDGHTNVYPPQELRDRFYAAPPLSTRPIEGRVIITNVYSPSLEKLGLATGQEITHIDGVEVHRYAELNVAPFVSSSTPQDRALRTYGYHLLNGNAEIPVTLTISGDDNTARSIEIARTGYEDVAYPPANAFRMLEGNIAYLELRSFGNDSSAQAFEDALERIREADGLILDVRRNGGGSTTQGYRVLAHLTDQPIVGSRAAFRDGNPLSRARGSETVDWSLLPAGTWSSSPSPLLKLPVAVLAGPATFSAAEDFLVAFRLLERGPIVGRPTGGSTGQPLFFDLPGGGTARICVKRDSWPDGTDWVGTGIHPDIEAVNTVEDIRAARDAVLEAARLALLGTNRNETEESRP